jgi:nitroreductase
MQPWRFRIIRGAARTRFSEALVAAARVREPSLAAAQLEKLRTRPLQVPLVIAASARLRDNAKVPNIEQLLSSGAAVMNLLNAFHALGFGAIWLTGPSAYDPAIAAAVGLADDEQLLGFVYVGTIGAVVPAAPERPAQAGFVSEL